MKPRSTRNLKGAAPSTRREEKLSALAALLGPDAMDRLRRRDNGFRSSGAALSATDQDRIAWQRNNLLERLRERWPEPGAAESRGVAPQSDFGASATREQSPSGNVDTRIASAMDLSTLADEHPAVITRVLEKMDREQRVSVLRALPGPIARAAIRRLRSSD